MQVTSRVTGVPLDKMTIETCVTNKLSPDEVIASPIDGGMYVHGIFMEGARWEISVDENIEKLNEDSDNKVEITGQIEDGILKKLLAPMPLLHLRAVPIQNHWLPSSVGYLRQV